MDSYNLDATKDDYNKEEEIQSRNVDVMCFTRKGSKGEGSTIQVVPDGTPSK